VERYPGQKICIVAHNMVIRAVVAHALCAPVESMYHIDVLPCSITTVAVWPSDGLRALKSMSERAVTS
jgi:probable phosphoglycerate mutase